MELFQVCAYILIYVLLRNRGINAYDASEKTCVMVHNKLRKLHGAQPLLWSEELGDQAQKWCEKLAMNDVLEHDNKTIDYNNVGENLASVNGSSLTTRRLKGVDPLLDLCPKVVLRWYSEEVNYNYKTGMPKSNGLPINHFAQVVWNSTFEIGVGSARSSVHGDIVCVRYSPRGANGDPEMYKNNIFPKIAPTPSPETTQPTATTLADQNLSPNTANFIKRYTGSVSCGVGRQSRIVGGERAKPAEFPWQVGIIYSTSYGRSGIFCGGSLIDPKWVVSAAHCFQRRVSYDTAVLLGEFDVNNEEGNEVKIVAKQVINHPRYSKRTNDYDIALLELEREVEFNDFMKPVCLPRGNINFGDGKMCTVTGFGAIREGGPQATALMKADVPLVPMSECKKAYPMTPAGERLKVCAGYAKGKIDSCQGDSGGPLVCQEGGKFYLTGVVSYGKGCARPGYPGVYANVKNLMEWIQQMTGI